MKSNEYIKQLIKLSEDNPELEIKAKVDTECCPSDEHTFWISEIGKSEIDDYWQNDEIVYISKDIIEDHIRYLLEDKFNDDFNIDTAINGYYESLKATGKIKTAIFVMVKP